MHYFLSRDKAGDLRTLLVQYLVLKKQFESAHTLRIRFLFRVAICYSNCNTQLTYYYSISAHILLSRIIPNSMMTQNLQIIIENFKHEM